MLVQVGHVEARQRAAAGDARLGGAQRRPGGGEAAHRGAEAVLEIETADLAVGDDLEPEILLEADRVAHRMILDAPELLLGHATFVERRARFAPGRGAQQAADHVSAQQIQRARHSVLGKQFYGALLRTRDQLNA